jgi:hypothetical protein
MHWLGLQELLSATGVFYMVVVEENRPSEIMDLMRGYGLQAEVGAHRCRIGPTMCWGLLLLQISQRLRSRKARNELLSVLKISRRQPDP